MFIHHTVYYLFIFPTSIQSFLSFFLSFKNLCWKNECGWIYFYEIGLGTFLKEKNVCIQTSFLYTRMHSKKKIDLFILLKFSSRLLKNGRINDKGFSFFFVQRGDIMMDNFRLLTFSDLMIVCILEIFDVSYFCVFISVYFCVMAWRHSNGR